MERGRCCLIYGVANIGSLDFTSNNAALYMDRDDAACFELFTFYVYNKFDRIVVGTVKFYGFTCINTGDAVLHTSLLFVDTAG